MNVIYITICALFILLGFEIRYRQLNSAIEDLKKEVDELHEWAVFVRTPGKPKEK
ncbi:MAG TPA: hypothetical protein P5110_04250 [Candidatus Omnitrophota bacterium]|nr:hypothetical protein [Candidatus Omnitrophota bacterium]HRZ14704.1 hypothetical protein [Candidatus Omnitrophota bacterium]